MSEWVGWQIQTPLTSDKCGKNYRKLWDFTANSSFGNHGNILAQHKRTAKDALMANTVYGGPRAQVLKTCLQMPGSLCCEQIICRWRRPWMHRSLPSQRGLSKSSAGRLPFPFPVGHSGRVYFEPPANNVDGLVQIANYSLRELTAFH